MHNCKSPVLHSRTEAQIRTLRNIETLSCVVPFALTQKKNSLSRINHPVKLFLHGYCSVSDVSCWHWVQFIYRNSVCFQICGIMRWNIYSLRNTQQIIFNRFWFGFFFFLVIQNNLLLFVLLSKTSKMRSQVVNTALSSFVQQMAVLYLKSL